MSVPDMKVSGQVVAVAHPLAIALQGVPPPKKVHDGIMYRPWVFVREPGVDRVQAQLRGMPRRGNTVMGLGSSFAVFDLAVQRGLLAKGPQPKLEHIIIFDVSERVEHFWMMMLPKIRNLSRVEFLDFLRGALFTETNALKWFWGHPNPEKNFGFCAQEALLILGLIVANSSENKAKSPAEKLALMDAWMTQGRSEIIVNALKRFRELTIGPDSKLKEQFVGIGYDSWLFSDQKFEAIKRMNIVFVKMDLLSFRAVKIFRKVINGFKLEVDMVYLSNLSSLEGSDAADFQKSSTLLTDGHTIVVEAKPEKALGDKPVQTLRECTVETLAIQRSIEAAQPSLDVAPSKSTPLKPSHLIAEYV